MNRIPIHNLGVLGQKSNSEWAPLPMPDGALYRHPNPDGSRKKCGNCVSVDELVLVNGVAKKISDAPEGEVLTKDGWRQIAGISEIREQPLVKVRSTGGLCIKTTPDHRFHTDQGWVSACDLKSGRKGHILSTLLEVSFSKRDFIDRKEALLRGTLAGDGGPASHKLGTGVRFSFRPEMIEAWKPVIDFANELFESNVGPCLNVVVTQPPGAPYPKELPLMNMSWRNEAARKFWPTVSKDHVHPEVWKSTPECIGSYLKGLFSTDGSVCCAKDPRNNSTTVNAVLWNTSKTLIDEIRLLLRGVGIISSTTLYIRAPKYKDIYMLAISRKKSLERFLEIAGFMDTRRQEILENGVSLKRDKPFVERIRSVEPAGNGKVMDLSVPGPVSFYASGFLVHNCFMYVPSENACAIHLRDQEVLTSDLCGYHIFGKPMERWMDHPGMQAVTPNISGLRPVGAGAVCANCRFYRDQGNGKGLCYGVSKPDDRKPPQPVELMGFCARYESM